MKCEHFIKTLPIKTLELRMNYCYNLFYAFLFCSHFDFVKSICPFPFNFLSLNVLIRLAKMFSKNYKSLLFVLSHIISPLLQIIRHAPVADLQGASGTFTLD